MRKRKQAGGAITLGVALVLLVIGGAGRVWARPNVELKYSGPGNQGDLIWWSRSTGTTNLVLGTNGIYGATWYGDPVAASEIGAGTFASDVVYSNVDGRIDASNVVLYGEVQVDTINEKGSSGVIVEGLTLNDGAYSDSDGALTLSNVTLTATTASKPVFTDANKKLVSTGTLCVDQGGSGATSLTDHGVVCGSGTAAVTPLAVGATNTVLCGMTGADPSFRALQDSDLADNIVPADEVGPGTFASDVVYSNITGRIDVSNVVARGNVTLNGDVVRDSKYAPFGNAAYLIDHGTCTNGQPLVTFNIVFDGSQTVVFNWADAIGSYSAMTNTTIGYTSLSTTSCIPNTAVPLTARTNMSWFAIGARP